MAKDDRGHLGAADRERVRLHLHWTERVLASTPLLAPLAALAAAHHERLDGSGYHRAARAADLPRGARLLAAADVLAAMTEDRPHRRRTPATKPRKWSRPRPSPATWTRKWLRP